VIGLRETEKRIISFLGLTEGWDGYGGSVISEKAIQKAILVLRAIGIQPDGVFPVGRGSVQLEYHFDERYFEVEVGKEFITCWWDKERVHGKEEAMLVGKIEMNRLPVLVPMNTALRTLGLKDRRAVARLVELGKISGRKVGRYWRIDRDSLREYCKKNPSN